MITIQQADPKDSQHLTQLCRDSKRYWNYPEEWIERWLSELTITSDYIQKHAVLTITYKDQIVGFCSVESLPEYFEIAHFWIAPSAIKKGFGDQLIRHILTHFTSKEIQVLADPNAAYFYGKYGFEIIDHQPSSIPNRVLPIMKRRQKFNEVI